MVAELAGAQAEAADGAAALRRWKADRPDIIVLDLGLPSVDGFEVLRKIREESETPVLILTARPKGPDLARAFNLGTDEYCQVSESVELITSELGLAPDLVYTGGDRGWIGDSPFIFLDCRKIRALGWAPKVAIRDGIVRTLEYLRANTWIFEARG